MAPGDQAAADARSAELLRQRARVQRQGRARTKPLADRAGHAQGQARGQREDHAEFPADRACRLRRRQDRSDRTKRRNQDRPAFRARRARRMAGRAAFDAALARQARADHARHRCDRRPAARFGRRAADGIEPAAAAVRDRAQGPAEISVRLHRADHQQGLRHRCCSTRRPPRTCTSTACRPTSARRVSKARSAASLRCRFRPVISRCGAATAMSTNI